MPDFERITYQLAREAVKDDPIRTAYLKGRRAGKTQARREVVQILLFALVMFVLAESAVADEHQYDEQALWGETNLQLDEDEPDQDPVYDEDDLVYDESDDYLDEDYEDE